MGIHLEAGKTYRTAEGCKAYVLAVDIPGFGNRAIGFIEKRKPRCKESVDQARMWFNTGGTVPESDVIVAEWVEPRRIKGWVNLYRVDNNYAGVICNNAIHASKSDADEHAVGGRFACIEIDVLEGQGLDGSAA